MKVIHQLITYFQERGQIGLLGGVERNTIQGKVGFAGHHGPGNQRGAGGNGGQPRAKQHQVPQVQ